MTGAWESSFGCLIDSVARTVGATRPGLGRMVEADIPTFWEPSKGVSAVIDRAVFKTSGTGHGAVRRTAARSRRHAGRAHWTRRAELRPFRGCG